MSNPDSKPSLDYLETRFSYYEEGISVEVYSKELSNDPDSLAPLLRYLD